MNTILVIWTVWAALGLALMVLLLYHIHLTQDEEDRLFLDGGNEMSHREQEEMTAKLNRLKPAIRILGGAEGMATLVLVGFYLLDALRQF